MMMRGKIFALLAPIALVIAVLGSGPGARVSGANSAESPAVRSLLDNSKQASQVPYSVATSSGDELFSFNTCPAGYRALFMTNNCNQDIWFAENPSAAPGGTPNCPDPTNAGDDNFGCPTGTTCNSGGVCVTSCNDPGVVSAPDCGPNQTCTDGSFTQMQIPSTASPTPTPVTIYECFANHYEPSPVSTPTPSSGSGWDLVANGGRSVICVPEAAPSSGASPQATCSVNTDCQSDVCASKGTDSSHPNQPGDFCLPSESGCQCENTITWSGNFWGRTECTYSGGNSLSCLTGDCEGKVDCTVGPANPATLAEMTLLTPSDPNSQDSYDVSMVNGFNVGYSMKAVKGSYSGTCGAPGLGCSFNINANCPAELQLTDNSKPPNVIGCYTPGVACADGSPSALLNCSGAVPFQCATSADCPYGHQMTPAQTMTCSAGQCGCTMDTDCPQGFTCNSGSCTYSTGPTATWADLYGCQNFYDLSPLQPNIFPSWLKSTAEETGITCGCPSWSTGCKAYNYNWETSAIGNGNSKTVEDYYQIFHNGCASAYSYAYDDAAGTDSCAPSSSGAAAGPSYDIEFCPAASSSPTATPTATASSTATATMTATATATATSTTATATATASPTATATATATATFTSTGTPTATSTSTPTSTLTTTSTPTATATGTATATATTTQTPSPTGTATPNCGNFGYLSTVPAGTIAFGDVAPGGVATASLTVTNEEPAGTLKLSEKISNIPPSKYAKYFSVTGGTCKTEKELSPGGTCTYDLQLRGSTKTEGDAVNADFVITGKFANKACPARDVETAALTLAGAILEPNARAHDSR